MSSNSSDFYNALKKHLYRKRKQPQRGLDQHKKPNTSKIVHVTDGNNITRSVFESSIIHTQKNEKKSSLLSMFLLQAVIRDVLTNFSMCMFEDNSVE